MVFRKGNKNALRQRCFRSTCTQDEERLIKFVFILFFDRQSWDKISEMHSTFVRASWFSKVYFGKHVLSFYWEVQLNTHLCETFSHHSYSFSLKLPHDSCEGIISLFRMRSECSNSEQGIIVICTLNFFLVSVGTLEFPIPNTQILMDIYFTTGNLANVFLKLMNFIHC